MEENKRVLEALHRLSKTLVELDDGSSGHALSHWRELTSEVSTAYKVMVDGAGLVKATSTKYTLVGKIDIEEGAKLSQDLLKGCELLCTGVLVLCNNDSGCARSTRYYSKQAARGVVATVIALVESFVSESAMENKNLAAQKTGAVWETCVGVEKVPKGNRAAMRRDLLTWSMECNETMKEFTDVIEEGPSAEETNDTSWDEFCDGESDRYTSLEMPIAVASVALLKCSRGTMNVALKTCEAAGEQLDKDEDTAPLLEWMSSLFDLARVVGEGVTDLGTLLYPPLAIDGENELKQQLAKQRDAILDVHNFVLDACPTGRQEPLSLPEDATEMSEKLRTAARARYDEAQEAILAALKQR